MSTTAIVAPTAPPSKDHATLPETRQARNRRVTLEALRAGVRVDSFWGSRFNIWSGRSQHLYEVHRLEDGPVIEWVCTDHCDWFIRHGELQIFNAGTCQQTKNRVLPCAHVLLARLAAMGAVKRADLFSADPELATAWRAAHAGAIV